MTSFAIIYLTNLAEFYQTAAKRIIDPNLRKAFAEIAESVKLTEGMLQVLHEIPEDLPSDKLLAGLPLHDFLKKPTSGTRLGRTVISIEEAIEKARMIEETGIILFQVLSEQYPRIVKPLCALNDYCRNRLAAILELNDALKYRSYELFQT